MKTLLITGGAGFIGSNFVHHLYGRYPDYRILVLDALTYAGSLENLPGGLQRGQSNGRPQFWYGDVRNASLVDSLVAQSDVVVHFAAETHVTRSIYGNYHFFETDVLGTQVVASSVLKHIGRVDRFIHVSTSEVYGTARAPRMDEDAPLMPMSPYASAKAGADRLVYSHFVTYDLPAIVVRSFNECGPRQHLEKVIPRFITSCILDEPLRVHGDGSVERDFTYVEDTCRVLDCLAHCELDPVRFRRTANIGKAEQLLSWRPRISFEEGLERAIEWYVANRAWWEKQLWMRDSPIITKTGTRELH